MLIFEHSSTTEKRMTTFPHPAAAPAVDGELREFGTSHDGTMWQYTRVDGPLVIYGYGKTRDEAIADAEVVGTTAKTAAERKAAERQRRSDAGLVRLELYSHPEDHAAIKEHAAKLQRKREKAHGRTTSRT
jgi:hypothetical protein